jgi:hypothetical protein
LIGEAIFLHEVSGTRAHSAEKSEQSSSAAKDNEGVKVCREVGDTEGCEGGRWILYSCFAGILIEAR